MWVLGFKLRAPARAASTLKHCALSLRPQTENISFLFETGFHHEASDALELLVLLPPLVELLEL